MAKREIDSTLIDECVRVLVTTPIPGLATGLGELPRFRSELGTFIGVVAAVRGNTINGGFVLLITLVYKHKVSLYLYHIQN